MGVIIVFCLYVVWQVSGRTKFRQLHIPSRQQVRFAARCRGQYSHQGLSQPLTTFWAMKSKSFHFLQSLFATISCLCWIGEHLLWSNGKVFFDSAVSNHFYVAWKFSKQLPVVVGLINQPNCSILLHSKFWSKWCPGISCSFHSLRVCSVYLEPDSLSPHWMFWVTEWPDCSGAADITGPRSLIGADWGGMGKCWFFDAFQIALCSTTEGAIQCTPYSLMRERKRTLHS